MSNKHRHPAILVASPRDGFRRGGHEFGTRPKALALGALSAAQHAAIVNDPALVVLKTAVDLETHEVEALPHREAPHVITALVDAPSLTLDVSEGDAKRTLALDEREARLVEAEKKLEERARQQDTAFEEATALLESQKASLVYSQADLDEKRVALEAERAAFEEEKKSASNAGARHGQAKRS